MADLLEPGQVVAGRYVVEALVGVGGLAEVYRVRQTDLGSVHALKLLTWRRKQLTERFEREGRFQAQLGHPNVVTVTDFVRFDGHVALVMEFVDGPTLEQLITDEGPLPPQDAFALFVPILAAVTAAHDRGVWHRDLKPANVLLARTAVGLVPKVADFGIAKFMTDEMGGSTSTGMAMGSPGYMAPEQVRDSSTVDARADIFALGAILFEMLTGNRAFADPDGNVSFASTIDREPPPLDLPGVEPSVAAAIRQAMRQDREQRFPDCRAFARALGVAAHPMLLDLADGQNRGISFSPSVSIAPRTPRTPGAVVAVEPTVTAPTSTGWLMVPVAAGTVAATLALGVIGAGIVAGALWWSRNHEPTAEVVAPIAAPAPVPAPAAPTVSTDPAPAAVTPTPPPVAPAVAPTGGGPIGGPTVAPSVEPAPVEPAPAEPAPAPEPTPVPAPAVVSPVPDVVPEPAPAPAPPVDAMAVLGGPWIGKADGRRFQMKFESADGRTVRATATFIGQDDRIIPLTGTYDPVARTVTLTDGKVQFNGRLNGSTLSGTYGRSEQRDLAWTVSR